MIIYEDKLNNFIDDVILNNITDKLSNTIREKHLLGGSPSEINSWNNSLHFMKDVLQTPEIPTDCVVAIEYNIPQTSKRVDFMVLGQDEKAQDHVVIVELKQWAKVSKVDDYSRHSVMSDLRSHEPVAHPSYQAYSYKALIQNYCSADGIDNTDLNPCAYLHNMPEEYRNVLEDDLYKEWIEEAPVFLKKDVLELRDFIKQYITAKSSNDDLLYKMDFGRIKPTKALQDSIDSMLLGNEEFKMIDEQAVAYDFIMKGIKNAQSDNKKHVIIIEGGPGTGKSVLAINVLADCVRELSLNAAYITKNRAPRECFKKILSRGNAKKEVNLSLLFRSPHSLPGTPVNGIDVGIFDEAHRMQKRPYMYKGYDMLEDAINASKVSVFLVDEDQRITVDDCYSIDLIKQYAERLGAVVDTKEPFVLESQFRCNGSDGYIAFLDKLLEIKPTENTIFDLQGFDLKVFNTPQEMKDALQAIDNGRNKSRMCAGYCYDWNVKYNRGEWDVVIGDFKAKWNLENDNIFAINPNSFNEIGCIHTVQGMEFDYIGVIIGKDLTYDGNHIVTNQNAISKDDRSSGLKTCKDKEMANRIIKNTYKVLLTRGQKGCYVYCEDQALSSYIKQRIKQD